MGIPDNQFDDYVAMTLQTQTVVTHRQKDHAWERLHKHAKGQVMLVAYAAQPAPVQPALSQRDQIADLLRRLTAALLTDDRMYHRAAETRRRAPITTVLGSVFVIHAYMPVRYYAY